MIDKIVQQPYTPNDKNVIWDDGETLKINRNGIWEDVVQIPKGVGSFNVEKIPTGVDIMDWLKETYTKPRYVYEDEIGFIGLLQLGEEHYTNITIHLSPYEEGIGYEDEKPCILLSIPEVTNYFQKFDFAFYHLLDLAACNGYVCNGNVTIAGYKFERYDGGYALFYNSTTGYNYHLITPMAPEECEGTFWVNMLINDPAGIPIYKPEQFDIFRDVLYQPLELPNNTPRYIYFENEYIRIKFLQTKTVGSQNTKIPITQRTNLRGCVEDINILFKSRSLTNVSLRDMAEQRNTKSIFVDNNSILTLLKEALEQDYSKVKIEMFTGDDLGYVSNYYTCSVSSVCYEVINEERNILNPFRLKFHVRYSELGGDDVPKYYIETFEYDPEPNKFKSTIEEEVNTGLYQIVSSLPKYYINSNKIYLLPSTTTEEGNLYDEYVYANETWEKIGSISSTSGIIVDQELNAESTNAISNKAVAEAIANAGGGCSIPEFVLTDENFDELFDGWDSSPKWVSYTSDSISIKYLQKKGLSMIGENINNWTPDFDAIESLQIRLVGDSGSVGSDFAIFGRFAMVIFAYAMRLGFPIYQHTQAEGLYGKSKDRLCVGGQFEDYSKRLCLHFISGDVYISGMYKDFFEVKFDVGNFKFSIEDNPQQQFAFKTDVSSAIASAITKTLNTEV
jgi:hypothetical protein